MSLSNDNTKTKRMESWETSLSNTLSKPRIKRGLSFQSSLKSNQSKKYVKFSAFQPQSEKTNGIQQYGQNQQQKQKGISQFLLESLQEHQIKKAESIKYEDSKSHKKDLNTSRRKSSLSQSNLAEDKLTSSKKIVFYNPDEHKQIDIETLKDKRNSYKNLQFKKKCENIEIEQLIAKQYEQIQKQKIVQKVSKFISEKGPQPGENCKNEILSLIFGCEQNNIRTITENSNQQDIAQHEQQINMCTSCKKFEGQKNNAVNIFRIVVNFLKQLRVKFQQIQDEVVKLKLQMNKKIEEMKRFSSVPINFNNMCLKKQLANLNMNKNRDENSAKCEIEFLQKCQTQRLLKKQEVIDQFKLRKGYHEAFESGEDQSRKIQSIETYFKNLNRSDKSLSQIGSIGKIVKNNGVNKFGLNNKFNLPKYNSVTLQSNEDNPKLHDKREFRQTPPKLQQPPSSGHENSVDTSFFSQKQINRAQFFDCNKHEDVLNFTALDLMGPKKKQKELKNSLLSMRGALAKLSQLCQK